MAELCLVKVGAKVASWPILGRKFVILAIFFEIWSSNLFCSSFFIGIKGQTKWEVNWIQIDHFSLQKTIKMSISSKSHFAQVPFTKKPTITFFVNLSETFGINVNMGETFFLIFSLRSRTI